MKKILVLFIFLSVSVVFAKEEQKKYQDQPSYVSILQKFGAISVIGGAAEKMTNPMTWTMLETQLPLYRTKSYLYLQMKVGIPLIYSARPFSLLLPIINLEAIRAGGGIGIGGYLADNRNEKGRGWSVALNGLLLAEAGVYSYAVPNLIQESIKNQSIENKLLNLGAEINLRAIYSIRPHVNFVIGADVSYLYALGTGDPFYINAQKKLASYHTISYGLTIGMSF